MDSEKIRSTSCSYTSNDGLFVPNRHESALVAGIIAVISLSFLTGYFLGKKQAIEPFTHKIEQDSFADQIFSSLCAISDQDYRADESDDTQLSEDTSAAVENEAPVAVSQETAAAPDSNNVVAEQARAAASERYYAQLVGFGTNKAAQKCAQKLQKKGVSVTVKTRHSTTAKGRKIAWYQVVTQPYNDRGKLENLVDRIAKEERLKGVRIVTV